MISWVVASHREDILQANLLATLNLHPSDELVVVRDAPSITLAYTEGQARATKPIRCYVHSDVQVVDPQWLRDSLIGACTERVGIVGLVGSRDVRMPWWDGDKLGSVVDSRMGVLNFGQGGPCAMLDGLLLATVHQVQWDTGAPGWHGYDHDACAQQLLEQGRPNLCLSDGASLVRHNSDSPFSLDAIDGWAEAAQRWHARWAAVRR